MNCLTQLPLVVLYLWGLTVWFLLLSVLHNKTTLIHKNLIIISPFWQAKIIIQSKNFFNPRQTPQGLIFFEVECCLNQKKIYHNFSAYKWFGTEIKPSMIDRIIAKQSLQIYFHQYFWKRFPTNIRSFDPKIGSDWDCWPQLQCYRLLLLPHLSDPGLGRGKWGQRMDGGCDNQ